MKKMVGRRVLGFAMASVMAMGMGTAAMAEETTYPMDTDATFVYWGELNGSVSANFNSLADTEIGKDWQEKTGRRRLELQSNSSIRQQDRQLSSLT